MIDNIIKSLRETNSKRAKELILSNNSGVMLSDVLFTTYNPDLVYNIKFKDNELDLNNLGSIDAKGFTILSDIYLKKIVGNAARAYIETYSTVNGDLIKLICNKDLRCGISSTTINKVFPGLIPTFKVQLAKELKNPSFPCLAQLKYDGVRIVIMWNGDNVIFKTRNGKVPILPQMQAHIEAVLKEHRVMWCIFDSEVTLINGKTTERTKVSGLINSAMKGGVIDESELVFNVFDILPYDQFMTQECDATYQLRLDLLTTILTNINSPYLKIARTFKVDHIVELESLFRETINSGQEGLIIKYPHHFYNFKRSSQWGKMKSVETADLTCYDFVEGTGKFEGLIGALKCKGIVKGKEVTVKVGTGLTDIERTVSPEDYIGKTIEVKYNDTIIDSVTEKWSLFLPRFVCVRFDK